MHHKLIIFSFLVATFSLTGCQSGVSNIGHSRNSEMGQAISRLDETERQYNKNVAAYRQAMMDYEKAHGRDCGSIFFSSLSTPTQSPEPRVQICKLQGSSKECGYQDYKVRISFKDDACFTVKTVEILDRSTQ